MNEPRGRASENSLIKGRNKGRSIGIIDTIHLVEVTQAAKVLENMNYLSGEGAKAIEKWFSSYLY